MAHAYDPERFGQFERQGWETVAARYDNTFGRITRAAIPALLEAVRAQAGMHVLDLACGPGYGAAAAAQRGCSAIGLDFAAAAVQAAQSLFPQVEFRQGNAEALPFATGSFDAVICNFGMRHFPHPERALAEAWRVLKAGGRIAFTDWRPPAGDTFRGLVAAAVRAHGDPAVVLPPGPPVDQFCDADFCAAIVRQAGFTPPEVSELPLELSGIAPEQVIGVVNQGMVRVGELFRRQPAWAQAAIAQAVTEAARRFAANGMVRIPCPAFLVAASKS